MEVVLGCSFVFREFSFSRGFFLEVVFKLGFRSSVRFVGEILGCVVLVVGYRV